MVRLVGCTALVLLASIAPALMAQDTNFQASDSYKAYQLDRLDADRALYKGMVDSMSHHAFMAGGMHSFAMRARRIVRRVSFSFTELAGGHGPSVSTPADAMMTQEGLREYIDAVYDFGAQLLRSQSQEERQATVDFFGTPLPVWRVWDALHEQALWNAGQLVHFFRDHNLVYPTPPLTSDAAPVAPLEPPPHEVR